MPISSDQFPGSEWGEELDAQAASRATKEYLTTLDDPAFGAASSVTPKFVSPSDPARPMDRRDARTGVLRLRQ
jgi:hypothetical protein